MARTSKPRRNKNQSSATNSQDEPALLPEADLTLEEESDRFNLERKVERSFFIAGSALMELRDRRLYRSTHATFEEYCRSRFDYTRRRPYQLIEAAQIYQNLIDKCEQIVHILPTKEGQVRPLSQLDKEEQASAWSTAVEEAGGKLPTGRIVKEVVQRIKDKTQPPIPFQVGEVCFFIAKDNPELRGKGGCWCIVSKVHEFSCTVNTWDNQYLVRPEHLKSLEFGESQCKQMEYIGLRMSLLYETGQLDEAALWILNGLARIKRPTLTSLEEKLLTTLEIEYETQAKTQLLTENKFFS